MFPASWDAIEILPAGKSACDGQTAALKVRSDIVWPLRSSRAQSAGPACGWTGGSKISKGFLQYSYISYQKERCGVTAPAWIGTEVTGKEPYKHLCLLW